MARRTPSLKKCLILFSLLLLVGMIGMGIFAYCFIKPYKERAALYDMSKIDDVEVKSLILDVKGREIGRFFVENRDKISINAVPQNFINALIASEDQRFFKHDGVDRIGVLRAIWLNLKAGYQTQGASSITQQLARNAFHLKEEAIKRNERGIPRKAVEAFLAIRIEKHYSKRQILEFYLNRIPFGSGFYGIRSASLGYFGKQPMDLSISQCASLVACIKNPSNYSPLNSLKKNKIARNQVLKRMEDEGFLSKEKSQKLQSLPVVVSPKPIRRGTSHLYERIAALVRAKLGEDALTEGGYRIFTTIDLDLQQSMSAALESALLKVEASPHYNYPTHARYDKKKDAPHYLQSAGIIIDNTTGAVRAYIGGRDFNHSQYDFLLSGKKPAGTCFLPFIYATALKEGYSLASTLLDQPLDNRSIMIDGREGVLAEWGMEVPHPPYEGSIPLYRSLSKSKISASVRLGKALGLGKVMETARSFGLAFPPTGLLPRMLVGTDDFSLLSLTRAYGTFSNKGVLPANIHFVTRIEDIHGKVRYQSPKASPPQQIISPEVAYLLHSALQEGLQRSLSPIDPLFVGQSGNCYDFSNHWFIGGSPRLSCGMWMGFWNGNQAIYGQLFSKQTLGNPWKKVMQKAQSLYPSKPLSTPSTLHKKEVCAQSGLLKTRYCPKAETVTFFFRQQNIPETYCDVHGIGAQLDHVHDTANTSLKHVIPIQPKEPSLLGLDPYNSYQPDFIPRDPSSLLTNPSKEVNFEFNDPKAQLPIPSPARIPIIEE